MSASNYQQNFMTYSDYCLNDDYEKNIQLQSADLKYEEQEDSSQNTFQIQNQGEQSYSVEQQGIAHIKNLIDPFDQQRQQQFGKDISSSHQFYEFTQDKIQKSNNGSHLTFSCSSSKSKKETLKEKREKKRFQLLERKNKKAEEQSSTQMDSIADQKEYTKEEKAERQRTKNRESASISLNRKKQQENTIEEDLKFLTQENKQFQSLIKQHFKCQQCGYFNDPFLKCQSENISDSYKHKIYENSKDKYFRSFNTDYKQNKYEDKNLEGAKILQDDDNNASNPVFQFFDFSKANAQLSDAFPNNFSNFGKGVWNTTFIIFILYMMIVFAGQHTQENETLGKKFQNLQFLGPSAEVFEQYKDLTQEQLLEELLNKIQKLNDSEKQEQIQQLKIFQVIAGSSSSPYSFTSEESYITTELNQSDKSEIIEESEKDFIIEESQSQSQASASTTATSIIMEKISALEKEFSSEQKPIQQNFLDFCKQYKEIQRKNEDENNYYKDLSKKLDELQKEKLNQIENLKQVYCPDTPSFLHQETDSSQYYQYEQYNSNKKSIYTSHYSENYIINQNINSKILEQPSHIKQNDISDQYCRNTYSNNNIKSYPSFDNISQFFNDHANFKESGRHYQNQNSSQNQNLEDNKSMRRLEEDQHSYQQYQQMIRKNKKYNKYQNESDEDSDNEEKNPFNILDEEEDPYRFIPNVSTNQKTSINYYELMQKKSNDTSQQANNQQNQVFSKQPQQQKTNYFDEYQNQNFNNSHKIQNDKNEKIQQLNLLLNSYKGNSNYYNNSSQKFIQNSDVEKYFKYSGRFLENNMFKKNKF